MKLYSQKIRYPNVESEIPSELNCLSDDLFFKYFKALPMNDFYFIENLMTIDLTTYSVNLPILPKIIQENFIIIPIRIVSFVNQNLKIKNYNFKTIGHTNVAIYDCKRRILDLFEPHGSKYMGYNPLNINISGIIHYYISELFANKNKVHLNIVHTDTDKFGLQGKQNLKYPQTGHCTAWVLLFIHFKMLNHQKNINYIIKEFNKNNADYLDTYIRKYLTFVQKNSNNFPSKSLQKNFLAKSKNLTINIDKNLITQYIKHLFDEFHKVFIKKFILNELSSFMFYYPELFNSVCLNYSHPRPFNCKLF